MLLKINNMNKIAFFHYFIHIVYNFFWSFNTKHSLIGLLLMQAFFSTYIFFDDIHLTKDKSRLILMHFIKYMIF